MTCGVSQSSSHLLNTLWSPQLLSIMSRPPTPPSGPYAGLVVIVVRQAEGVAGLVDGDQRIVGAVRRRRARVLVLPLPRVGAQPLAADGVGAGEVRLVAPPEARPAGVWAGPDDDQVVDDAVAVVVVLGGVPAGMSGGVGVEGLLDERLLRAVPGAHGAARRACVVPGQHVALDVQLPVGGAGVVVVHALVGEGGGVAVAEQAVLQVGLRAVRRVVAEADRAGRARSPCPWSACRARRAAASGAAAARPARTAAAAAPPP